MKRFEFISVTSHLGTGTFQFRFNGPLDILLPGHFNPRLSFCTESFCSFVIPIPCHFSPVSFRPGTFGLNLFMPDHFGP